MAPQVLVLTGPTATGKTALGVELALALGGEVVSADSMQIYRRMDIGTAKPRPEETKGVPHHMIDVAEPWERYSAARYVEEASRCVDEILARGKLPVIVGGTGLYIDSLLAGRDFAAGQETQGLREALSGEYDALGGEEMLRRLSLFDPERAEQLHPNDKKRIVRAFEVYEQTGETITAHDKRTREKPPRYEAVKLALDFAERERLYARIDRRVDAMFAEGLVEEVRSLLCEGVPPDSTAMQAIGYKELVRALAGETTQAQAREEIQRESRRYAKRQLTWLRRDGSLHWLRWENAPDASLARRLLTDYLRDKGLEW